jgi:hypothetical protein
MRLLDVSAQAHLIGKAIEPQWTIAAAVELRWTIAAAERAANPDWRVRAVRNLVSFPEGPEDGEPVPASENAEPTLDDKNNASYRCLDTPLRGETVYYYTLFPYTAGKTDFRIDRRNRTAVMTTDRYDLAQRLYELLPAIYHRYDTVEPPAGSGVPPPLNQAGQLRRLLEIVGAQYDQFYSLIRTLPHVYNVDRIDGRLLSLLGAWIGWESDLRQRIDMQRGELRFAPYIYQTIGTVPTIEATVKRVIGWESRVKEFVHNIFMTNAPEQFLLRVLTRKEDGAWTESDAPLSLDSAYGGRLAVAASSDDRRWLFYHTQREGRWEIWHKSYPDEEGKWTPSQATRRGGMDYRHPAAAAWEGGLIVFWDAYDRATGRWRIEFRTGDGAGSWSGANIFRADAPSVVERRKPSAVVDPNSRHLWLFWQQRDPSQRAWTLRFARFSLGDEINPATSFPRTGDPPADGNDLFPLVTTSGGASALWLFWARRDATNPHLWEIALRTKASLDPAEEDWGEIETLPKPDAGAISDREPAALVTSTGDIELFWSSNQDGAMSIWRALRRGESWSAREALTNSPFSQRNPCVFVAGDKTVLIYRDNAGVKRTSDVYAATETFDLRYSGSTTVDTRNRAKQDLWGRFEDFQTYLYDAGQNGQRSAKNLYARDTIGIFLTPNTDNPSLLNRSRNLIESALRPFIPIQVRIVLLIEPSSYSEVVYSYSFGVQRPPWMAEDADYAPRFIKEEVIDQIPETLSRPQDEYVDTVPGWVWIRTWRSGAPVPATVDTSVTPVDTHFRIFHRGLEEG